MGIFNKTRKEKIQAALSEIIVNNLDTDDSFNLWEFKDLLRRFKEYEAKECSYLKKYVSDETERILKLIFKQVKNVRLNHLRHGMDNIEEDSEVKLFLSLFHFLM